MAPGGIQENLPAPELLLLDDELELLEEELELLDVLLDDELELLEVLLDDELELLDVLLDDELELLDVLPVDELELPEDEPLLEAALPSPPPDKPPDELLDDELDVAPAESLPWSSAVPGSLVSLLHPIRMLRKIAIATSLVFLMLPPSLRYEDEANCIPSRFVGADRTGGACPINRLTRLI